MIGWAQRRGWIEVATTAAPSATAETSAAATTYICPMMCVPPTTEPGRCPVCAMELVPATSDADAGGERSVNIAVGDRRLIGIETVKAQQSVATRSVKAVGRLQVDETRIARVPADAAGRVEKLYFNFTGQQVNAGERIATYYSPDLYAAQTELLTLKSTRRPASGRRNSLTNVREEIIQSARQRLRELGMSAQQIEDVEKSGHAESRIDIRSPHAGTITKLMLREGQYLKAGEVACEVTDLSNVWLVTELFPEDAALVRYGQRVTAGISSLPGETFEGRVSFVAPTVDSVKRAVPVRIDLPNASRQLRPGDEATVEIEVPLQAGLAVYDEQLAGKWICPQHPDEIHDSAGACPRSGKPLVPTEQLGFATSLADVVQPLTIPRSAVLMAGSQSAVYVEVEEGEFELRLVEVGPTVGRQVVVLGGIEASELVATKGNFLIDSQMQLSGKPSLIDPSKAAVPEEEAVDLEITIPEFGPIETLESETPTNEDGAALPSLSIETPSDGPEVSDPFEAEATDEDEWELPQFGTPELMDDARRSSHSWSTSRRHV